MSRFHSLTQVTLTLAAVFLAAGCDRPNTSAETEELRRKVEQLKKDRRPPASRPESELAAELKAAREQLQIALVALEQEQAKGAGTEGAGAGGVGGEGDLDLEGVPLAVVVEEEDPAAALPFEEAEPMVALLDANDHQVFFAELGKFGRWFETVEFGFVWQPHDLKSDPSRRPYTRGRWVYSDQGWTWISEEPFGWAVYHYGRWALLEQYGWVWIPGDDWAPAWVAWRQNDEYLGWAPLPPETLYDDDFGYDQSIDLSYGIGPDYYNFVPVDYFYEPVQPYCVPRITVVNLVVGSRNVTRFSTRNRRVHCGGPDFGWVNRHARTRVRNCRLDLDGGRDRFLNRARPRLHNDRLEIFAPQVDAPWNPAVCPDRVAGHLGRVSVVRGKGEMDRSVVNRHHQAVVQRQVAARAALQTKACHEALRPNLERRRVADGREPRDLRGQRVAQAEQAMRRAVETAEATQRQLTEPGLNPKQRAYVELAAKNSERQLRTAREAHATAVEENAPAIARREGRPARDGGGRGQRQEGRSRPGEDPPRREPALVQAEEDAKSRQVQERRRAEEEQLRQREEAAAEDRAEARRRTAEQDLSGRQRANADRAARNAEKQRQAEEAAAVAAAEERRRQDAAQQQHEREVEAQARLAQQRKQDAAEREAAAATKRAQEAAVARGNSRRAELQRQRAEADRQRREAEDRAQAQAQAEMVRRAKEAQQQAEAEAQQRAAADQAQREAFARREAREARRQADAKQQEVEAKRQAAAAASRAESQRRAQEAQQAEAAAQRRAIDQQRQQEAKRQAAQARQEQAEAARRQQVEAARQQQQAEAARRQQAEAARQQQQQAEAARQQQQAEAARRQQAEAARQQQQAEAARRQAEAARQQQQKQQQQQQQKQRFEGGRGKRR